MFRYFENLVDPYGPYPQTDTPPRKLLPFLLTYAQPFRRVFWAAGLMSLVVAAVEVGLISYMGRIVDLLNTGDAATSPTLAVEIRPRHPCEIHPRHPRRARSRRRIRDRSRARRVGVRCGRGRAPTPS